MSSSSDRDKREIDKYHDKINSSGSSGEGSSSEGSSSDEHLAVVRVVVAKVVLQTSGTCLGFLGFL